MEYEWSSIIKSQKSLSLVVCKNYCKNLYVYCMPVHCVFQLVCIHWLSIIIDCTDEHTASSMQLILAVPLPTLLGSLRVLALVSKCTWQVWCWWAKACRNCIYTCIHIPWYYMWLDLRKAGFHAQLYIFRNTDFNCLRCCISRRKTGACMKFATIL